MITPGAGVRVYLACGVTDMRKGMTGLAAQEVLKRKPASGAVFLLSRSPRRPAEALVPGWPGVLPLLQGAAEGAFPVAVFGGRNGSAVDDRPVVDVVGRHRLAASGLDGAARASGVIYALNQ